MPSNGGSPCPYTERPETPYPSGGKEAGALNRQKQVDDAWRFVKVLAEVKFVTERIPTRVVWHEPYFAEVASRRWPWMVYHVGGHRVSLELAEPKHRDRHFLIFPVCRLPDLPDPDKPELQGNGDALHPWRTLDRALWLMEHEDEILLPQEEAWTG